jgi:small Trp-rich protein
MILILLIVGLTLLKYFEIGFMKDASWWWVIGLFSLTFIWFEFFERAFGLDKKKEHDQAEKMRKTRVKKTFGG